MLTELELCVLYSFGLEGCLQDLLSAHRVHTNKQSWLGKLPVMYVYCKDHHACILGGECEPCRTAGKPYLQGQQTMSSRHLQHPMPRGRNAGQADLLMLVHSTGAQAGSSSSCNSSCPSEQLRGAFAEASRTTSCVQKLLLPLAESVFTLSSVTAARDWGSPLLGFLLRYAC